MSKKRFRDKLKKCNRFYTENPEKAKPKRWIQPQVVKIDNCIELKLNEKYLLKIEISQVTSLK